MRLTNHATVYAACVVGDCRESNGFAPDRDTNKRHSVDEPDLVLAKQQIQKQKYNLNWFQIQSRPKTNLHAKNKKLVLARSLSCLVWLVELSSVDLRYALDMLVTQSPVQWHVTDH